MSELTLFYKNTQKNFFIIILLKRKNSEKDLTEKLENYNEKFTFAMQSFQSSLGSLGTRMSEQRDTVFIRKIN
jgi:hypothetical protein